MSEKLIVEKKFNIGCNDVLLSYVKHFPNKSLYNKDGIGIQKLERNVLTGCSY